MNRPKEVEEAMEYTPFVETVGFAALRDYVLSLESELAKCKGEEEEVWERSDGGKCSEGYTTILITRANQRRWLPQMEKEIVDEILHNREIVKRGIDWKKFWNDYSKRRTVHDIDAGAVQSLIEEQLKG